MVPRAPQVMVPRQPQATAPRQLAPTRNSQLQLRLAMGNQLSSHRLLNRCLHDASVMLFLLPPGDRLSLSGSICKRASSWLHAMQLKAKKWQFMAFASPGSMYNCACITTSEFMMQKGCVLSESKINIF